MATGIATDKEIERYVLEPNYSSLYAHPMTSGYDRVMATALPLDFPNITTAVATTAFRRTAESTHRWCECEEYRRSSR